MQTQSFLLRALKWPVESKDTGLHCEKPLLQTTGEEERKKTENRQNGSLHQVGVHTCEPSQHWESGCREIIMNMGPAWARQPRPE